MASIMAIMAVGTKAWRRFAIVLRNWPLLVRCFPAVLDALQITGVKDDHVVSNGEIFSIICRPFRWSNRGHDMIKRENYAWKYTRGLFKGETAVSDRTLAAGYILEEESVQPSLIPYEPDTIPTGIDIRKLIMQDQPLPRIDAFFRKMVKNENPFVPRDAACPCLWNRVSLCGICRCLSFRRCWTFAEKQLDFQSGHQYREIIRRVYERVGSCDDCDDTSWPRTGSLCHDVASGR